MTSLLPAFLCIAASAANPCSNGSFEQIGPDGIPVDWNPLNQVLVVDDAHSGKHALRLFRPADDPYPETGLNRRWDPRGGQQGAMLDRIKGGFECWYKALNASNGNLLFMVIPMDGTPFETGPSRTEYVVPDHHVGDGQWHRVRFKYDYSAYPEVKWVHFAARILNGAGEMLLDDFAYAENVGPCIELKGIRFEESANEPGAACTVHAIIENRGDAPSQPLSIRLEAPDSLLVTPGETALDSLLPDARQRVAWTVTGVRDVLATLNIRLSGGPEELAAPLVCAPGLLALNHGPASPVALEGESAVFECWVRNDSRCIVRAPLAQFEFSDGLVQATGPDLPPGASQILSANSRNGLLQKVTVQAANIESIALPGSAQTRIGDTQAPEPTGHLYSAASRQCAVLENDRMRLAFRTGETGFSSIEVQGRGGAEWNTIGWIPQLSHIAFLDAAGARGDLAVEAAMPRLETNANEESLAFDWSHAGIDGANWRATLLFSIKEGARCADIVYELACDRDRQLLRFDGPMVYALDRDEAVFPGLEWLVDEEISSSTLDIEAGHPHQVRYVPHPMMVTIPVMGVHGDNGAIGLLWDANQLWDGVRRLPSPVFASPDRFNNQRAHLMGLQLPTAPDFLEPNTRDAARPYPLPAGKTLRLECQLFVDAEAKDALAPMDEWFRIRSVPIPPSMPRGSLEGEVQFSMRAYLESLWDAETGQWWTTKNGPAQLAYRDLPKGHLADLLLGAQLSPDAPVRDACMIRARDAAAEMQVPLQREFLLQNGNTDFGAAAALHIANVLAARDERGFWGFDADREDQGIFKGFDYHVLGQDNAVAGGTCAENARTVLRFARVTGEWGAFNAIRNVLAFMGSEEVPRAAQVWEVPFHAPDILAAAQAVDAFLEAYRFTGDAVWLDAAVYWARRGLPFVYFWSDPERPFLLGATIPVYGASLMKYSWFGRPVQWNGLCYADALIALSEHDDTYPWRRVAELIVGSALHQQAAEGEDVALWPDAIGAVEQDKSAWVFPPRMILRTILKLAGRDEDAKTVFAGHGQDRIAITAVGAVTGVCHEGDTLRFEVTYPQGECGRAVIANITRPAALRIDGDLVDLLDNRAGAAETGCYYDDVNGFASIFVPKEGRSNIVLEKAAFRAISRLSEQTAELAFEFDTNVEGWNPMQDVQVLSVKNGTLTGRLSGPDPFIGRTLLRVDGTRYKGIEIRMRISGGATAQLYWSTADAPGFNEDRVRVFDVVPGTEFRTYRISMRAVAGWEGATITGLRLDPMNGVPEGEFAIEYLRGYGEGPGAGGVFRMSL